jgi:hypothetical protein
MDWLKGEHMRNPDRIKPFLHELEELWNQNPDFRFGQLLTMVFDKSNYNDPFFPEEEQWLEWIRKCKR